MEKNILIRLMENTDVKVIPKAFYEQGWNKPESQYIDYFNEQRLGLRTVLVAEVNNDFAGYITILWESDDNYFKSRCIPELKDFNVLMKFQKMGIGTRLMEHAEKAVFKKYERLGLSVGLLSGYGSAQRMYVKRGYVPTGEGFKNGSRIVEYFDNLLADDDLVLSFVKENNYKVEK